MKLRSVIGMCSLAVTLGLGAGLARAQDEKSQGTDMSQAKMEEMAAWMKAGTPNEHHTLLGHFVGQWDCTIKMWNPGMPDPMESTGTSVDTWVLGKRYVMTKFEGSFMGMPFEGMGITGYDNIRKHYFSTWIDTMSTGVMNETGRYDADTRTFTYTGTYDSPMGKTLYSKSVITLTGPGKYVFVMYHGEKKDALDKLMEITYTRASESARAEPPAGVHLASKTVEVGCARCVFHMEGVKGCHLAAKIDGKTVMVSGQDAKLKTEGLCRQGGKATVTGTLTEAELIATSLAFLP